MVEIARATDVSCQTEREGNLCNHLVQVLKDTQKGKDVPELSGTKPWSLCVSNFGPILEFRGASGDLCTYTAYVWQTKCVTIRFSGRDNQGTPTDEAWCQTDPDEVSGKALENDERATAIKLTQLIERDPRLAASLGSHLDKSSGSTTIVLNDCCGSGHRGVTPISDNNQTDKAKSLSRRNQSKKNKKVITVLKPRWLNVGLAKQKESIHRNEFCVPKISSRQLSF